MEFDTQEHPHRRYNPLMGEWVLVSPHRTKRPWSGQIEKTPSEIVPKYDPTNPLCPGVKRSSGALTPEYTSTYVFTNDFPALLEDTPSPPESDDPLFQTASARGTCKVICYHPHSDVYFTNMSIQEIKDIIQEWITQLTEIGKKFNWVQILENRGPMMGCSNPHPHCQIWASSFLPQIPAVKDKNLKQYYDKYGTPLLHDYVHKELKKTERIVWQNDEWVILVPYWAFWPFEVMILPKRQLQRLVDLEENQKESLAKTLQVLVAKYDNLFKCTFPYSMGWHGAPTGDMFSTSCPHWTLHAVYYPPLLRSATVRKFQAGYELLAENQRDISPEKAAAMLREQPEVRFT